MPQKTTDKVGLKTRRKGNSSSSSSNRKVPAVTETGDPSLSEDGTRLTKPVRVRLKNMKMPPQAFKTGQTIRVINKQTVDLNAEALRKQFLRQMATDSQPQAKGKKPASKVRKILLKSQSDTRGDALEHPQNLEENDGIVIDREESGGVYSFTCLRCNTLYATLKALKLHSTKHDSFNIDKDVSTTFTKNTAVQDTVPATDPLPMPVISSADSENPVTTDARRYPSVPLIRCRTDLHSPPPGPQLRSKPSPSVRYRDDFETVNNPSRSRFHEDDEIGAAKTQMKFVTPDIPATSQQSLPAISILRNLNFGNQNVNSDTQQHKCNVCNASFFLKSSLLVHKKRHEVANVANTSRTRPKQNSSDKTRNSVTILRSKPVQDTSAPVRTWRESAVFVDDTTNVQIKQEITGDEDIATAEDDPLMIA
eukprot:TRINITY_DN23490_c0_g1_i6.p1 TRINITY_DN23490_c0_g1~~TRINITY_DN23490_c0_g1_i6.p1  ORF type:complete len:422 (+),score=59.95 TRINITY_DN23490_c0_g1_i6:811-2076(+)